MNNFFGTDVFIVSFVLYPITSDFFLIVFSSVFSFFLVSGISSFIIVKDTIVSFFLF